MTISWLADKIEQWPTDKLVPYARNARTHSDSQVAQIAASIAEFGFTNPILAGSDGVIVAGHGRLAAAQKLGIATVPVVVLDHLTPTQRRALVIADNRIAENAGWDEAMLQVELADLQGDDFDLSLTGFDAATRRAIATALDDLAADDDLATIEPDEGIVRTIAAAAGGGSGLLAFVAGLVGSRLVSAGLESAGVTPRWQWIHSGNPKDFPPHADLDGVEFTSWDDPVLESAGSGFEWVGDSFSPTNGPGGPDHNGCGCVAVLVEGGSS